MILIFLCCLLSTSKHSGSYEFERIETKFVLLDLLCFEKSFPLRLEPHALGNEISNPVEGNASSPVE